MKPGKMSALEVVFVLASFSFAGLVCAVLFNAAHPHSWLEEPIAAACVGASGAYAWWLFCRPNLSHANSVMVGVVAGLVCIPTNWFFTIMWAARTTHQESGPGVAVFAVLLTIASMPCAVVTVPVGIITALAGRFRCRIAIAARWHTSDL
jgi:hypothetical protein